MGMDYGIRANIKTTCDGYFPEGLSNFLEQLPMTDYNSEVRQVSQILTINLDLFQLLDNGYPETATQDYWQDIDPLIALVESFLAKIAVNKQYYEEVRYAKSTGALNDQLHELLHNNNEAFMKGLLDQLYSNADTSFPPDHGYLRNGIIVQDLNELLRLLNCYKKAGATKVELNYA